MFSSCTNNSPHLLPQISPHTRELILLHHQDLLFTHFHLPEINPRVLQAAIDLPVQSNTALGFQDLGTSVKKSFPRRKWAVKNDRHSKIFTSTGPRDRRVRLSISIARRFFDLQDMLGFDKPSKTLDWLFTKSNTAIQELIRTKQCHNEVFSSSFDQCLNFDKSDEKSVEEVKDLVRVRDSRAGARARARERTRAKMCSKRVVNVRPVVDPVLDFNDLINQSQTRPSSSTSPIILGNYQHNLIASSDSTANAENWDISSIIRSQSSSSAIRPS